MIFFPRHQELVKVTQGGTRSGGDPLVIAVAKARGLTVVTGEGWNPKKLPTILSVCADEKIPCISFLKLMQKEGWTFRSPS